MADTKAKLDLFDNGNSLELWPLDGTPNSLGGAIGNNKFTWAVAYEDTAFGQGIRVDGNTKTTALSTDFYFDNITDKTVSVKFSMDAVAVNANEALISDASRYFGGAVVLAYVATDTDTLNVQFGDGLGNAFNMTGIDISALRGDGLLHTLTMSNEGDECYVWLDAVLQEQATSTTSLTSVSSNVNNGAGLMFGLISTVSAGADETWNGVLDQPRILSEAITTQDKARVIHFEDDSYWSAVTEAPSKILDFVASDNIEGYVQVAFTKGTGLPIPTEALYKGATLVKANVTTNYAFPTAEGTEDYHIKSSNSAGVTDSNIDSGTSLATQVPEVNPMSFLGDDLGVEYAYIGDEPITRVAIGDNEIYYWKNIQDKVYPSGIRTVRIKDYADKDAMTLVEYSDSEFSKLVPPTLDDNIFTSYSDTGASVYTQTAKDIDLSGVCHSDTHAGTLVTNQHIVVANHLKHTIGETIYFHDLDGVSYARTVTAEQSFTDTVSFEHISDVCVQKLNSPLPANIKVYPIMDRNGYDDVSILGAKIIHLDKDKHFNVAEIAGLGSLPATEYQYISHWTNDDYDYAVPTGGDSGSPSFVLINGELCLSHHLTTSVLGGTDGAGANYGDQLYLLVLDEIINSLGY